MFVTLLILLILLSAFFSACETSMMAVNRYRLRHLSRKSNKAADRVLKLLERPDRLLGFILLGNTFANILASAVATMLAVKWFGEVGAFIATIALTFLILIFAETAPKTLAVLYSQFVALWVSGILSFLLKICYPVVFLVNVLANSMLRLFGVQVNKYAHEPLSIDELRSIVHEATARTSSYYQSMLLRVLDLQQIMVEEAMVPKKEIYGIDLDQPWDMIISRLKQSPHAYLPLFEEHIDKIQGMLTLRNALVKLSDPAFDKTTLLALAEEVYFIPEGALLNQQLLNFQKEKQYAGLVVDEYGDVKGMLTLRDVLEEIAGEFTTSALEAEELIVAQSDGSVLVDASIGIRDLNRLANWSFPVSDAHTLSGLIIDYLETIPRVETCVRIAGYPMEVISVSRHTVRQVRVWPKLCKKKV